MSLSFAQSDSIVRQLGIKLHSTMKRAELEDKLKSTSPFAITSKIPTSRIVDNAIIKGEMNIAPVQANVVRGFFGGVRGVSVRGGDGRGRIETTVQFDTIYKCPVTGQEFRREDMESHKRNLESEVKWYVEDKLKTTIAENDSMTLKIRIATDGMVFMIEREQIEKLLSPELQGIEFAKALSKFKEKK